RPSRGRHDRLRLSDPGPGARTRPRQTARTVAHASASARTAIVCGPGRGRGRTAARGAPERRARRGRAWLIRAGLRLVGLPRRHGRLAVNAARAQHTTFRARGVSVCEHESAVGVLRCADRRLAAGSAGEAPVTETTPPIVLQPVTPVYGP